MKHRQILIRVFLVILCLPLSACLFGVRDTSGVKYPIGDNGVVDLRSLDQLQGLRLAGYNFFPSGSQTYASLQCKDDSGDFVELYGSNTTQSFYLYTQSDFWSSVASICNQDPVQLALKLGDKYAPIVTQAHVSCIGMALLIERKQLLPAIEGCLGPSYGFNSTVEGINVLTLLVPQ